MRYAGMSSSNVSARADTGDGPRGGGRHGSGASGLQLAAISAGMLMGPKCAGSSADAMCKMSLQASRTAALAM